jgi:hypothetical protein
MRQAVTSPGFEQLPEGQMLFCVQRNIMQNDDLTDTDVDLFPMR